MAASLKLQVVMSMVDKALAPLRGIDRQAKATAQGLKATREATGALSKQLSDIRGFHRMAKEQKALEATQASLTEKIKAANAHVQQQGSRISNMAASVKVARQAHDKLIQGFQDGNIESAAYIRQIELARITLLKVTQAHRKATDEVRREQDAIKAHENELGKLRRRQEEVNASLKGYKGRLDESGVGTAQLAAKLRQINREWKSGTTEVERQREAMAKVADQHRKMAALKEAHGKRMAGTAAMAGAGVAGVVTGAAVARPVAASMGAYAEQENAATQLKASMMESDGSVSAEFAKIDELAKRLGDRLPGTTAEFTDMMTMLRRQGISAQSILGGTGEAAALLGVQLRMPVTEAAEFAAKMQDATSTTEKDMLGLMDVIQRTYYLGVDSGNMLQGFAKLSPAMSMMKKKGLEASRILAPMLVMMDQTGMAGEQAGNAIRKVFQAGFDEKKTGKANALLKKNKAGFKLDFTDGKGEFGGVEKMFAQLKQLEKLDTQKRTSVIKELFGDDAETLQVLNTFMEKGIGGYKEVVAKMEAQADLRKRVDLQLGTLSNVVEAAQGTWTNVLASIGETVAPDAKNLVNWLAEAAASVGAWVKANPQLVAWLTKAAAAVAVLYVGIGGLMVGLAGVLAPLLVVRFALAAIGVQGGLLSVVLRGLGSGLRALGVAAVAGGGGAMAALGRFGLMLRALPALAIASGRSVAASFGVARVAIVGATARLWAYVAAQKAAALVGARRGLAAAGTAGVVTLSSFAIRGPVGLAKDTAAGLASMAGAAVRGGLAALAGGLGRVWAMLQLVGRAAFLNPVGLALTVLAGAALLVIKYWEPIKAFFSGLWSGFIEGLAPLAPMLSGVFGALGAMVAPLRPVWDALIGALSVAWAWCSKLFTPIDATAQSLQGATAAGQGFGAWLAGIVVAMAQMAATFFTFGANIVRGLIEGIQSMLGAARDAMGTLGRVLFGKFTGDMQIHSPSRVFRAAGVNVGEGAALGIEDTQALVRRAAAGMAAAAAVALPAPTLAVPPTLPVSATALPAPAIAPPVLPALPDIVQRIVAAKPQQLPDMVQRIVAGAPPQVPDLVQRLALAVPQAMPSPASGADGAPPALAQVQPLAPIDRRPPLLAPQAPRPAAPAPAAPAAGDRIEIHIHAAPGMDMQALAGMVKQQMERYEADKRARAGGGFYDLTN